MAKKIIVVDDSRTARQQVRNTLVEAGYEIVEAIDGNDGITKIAANADASLIICDVNMPNLNGLQMLTQLRATKNAPSMPIVMLTTEAQPQLLQQAKEAGAKGWIVKPFKPEMLVSAVRRLIGDD